MSHPDEARRYLGESALDITKFSWRGWSERRVGIFLFVALWLTFGFFPGDYWGPNSVTRMAVIFQIIDRQTVSLGEFAPLTGDKAIFAGTYVADKPPALSMTAFPTVAAFVWAARALHHPAQPIADGGISRFFLFATFVASFFTSGLFGAACGAMFYRLARHWRASRSAAILGTLAFAVATPELGWAGVFFAHATAGACLFLGFGIIVLTVAQNSLPPRRGVLAGFFAALLLAWGVMVEMTAAPAAAIIGAFGLWALYRVPTRRRSMIFAAALLGGIVGVAPTVIYNEVAFGTLLHVGYQNAVGFSGMHQGVVGISWPQWRAFLSLIFGGWRGMLWVCPLFVVAPFAYVAAFRALPTSAALVLFGVPAIYFVLISGFFYWWGGWSTGPRYVMPCLPFLAMPLVFLWQRAGRTLRFLLAGLALLSAADTIIVASVSMTAPQSYSYPLLQFILPEFRQGHIHNVLTLVGFQGFRTLLWLPVLWLVLGAAAVMVKPERPQASDP